MAEPFAQLVEQCRAAAAAAADENGNARRCVERFQDPAREAGAASSWEE
jgi:hypothetical protein